MMHPLLAKLQLDIPVIQAPMAGVTTPAMVAAASNAGALGSLAVAAAGAEKAAKMLAEIRAATQRAVLVNVFCHPPAPTDHRQEAAWIDRFRPEFSRYGAEAPPGLREIYQSFNVDRAMQSLLLQERPAVVSFHFGLPSAATIHALREARIVLLATATTLAEAKAAQAAGMDGVVAQGFEAGGHRGAFDAKAVDDELGTAALVRVLVKQQALPVIAAGGIMDGAGIAACLKLGAIAVQMGTAFIACQESSADAFYRRALSSAAAHHTTMTAAISGRRARCLANRFTALTAGVDAALIPAYPIAYDLGKQLHAAASTAGEGGFGAQWAGQGAPLSRGPITTAALIDHLRLELRAACSLQLFQ